MRVPLQQSAQDYLEMILMLKNRSGSVRSIDIVNSIGYSKPSVSIAMKKLRESGHIEVDEHGQINLTESGREAAEAVYERHRVLYGFLRALGVGEETAYNDACGMEHCLSDESFERLREFYIKNFEGER